MKVRESRLMIVAACLVLVGIQQGGATPPEKKVKEAPAASKTPAPAVAPASVAEPDLAPASPPAPLPDLVISEIKITSITGGKVEYCYRVVNNGQAAANLDGVVVRGGLSADENHDASDIAAGSHTLSGSLQPGQSIYCCCAGLAIVNPPQTPYLVVTVDADNAVTESDESNNSSSAEMTSVFTDRQEPVAQPPTVVQRTYAQTDIIVRARPAQTIVFEPPAPPNFIFLPQVVTAPRVINMQPPTARQVIVIGGETPSIQIPAYLLEYKPPCLCIPSAGASPGAAPTPAGKSVLQGGP